MRCSRDAWLWLVDLRRGMARLYVGDSRNKGILRLARRGELAQNDSWVKRLATGAARGRPRPRPHNQLQQVLHVHILLLLRFGDSGVGDVSLEGVHAFHQTRV